ncbi:hypothetical protein N7481_010602 [Penicillium waksmanii]|uniref:uncharacterized protein n=1 Tax=Penicillium waksmanii TaxID=69791 RepID=UPI0025495EBC|nr:uncharacterized protein N7481_010602 [Penicillium waksmanii]KAJ5973392.1 hypothetical protein N7481_010602 [Penicillium waksmanii]
MPPALDTTGPDTHHSDDSESEDDQGSLQLTSESRKVQNVQFQALLNQYARDPGRTIEAKAQVPTDRPDSELAISSLLTKHDPNPGHLDPRAYQIELFERAKLQNTIAVLDTGKWMTLIAVLLLKEILQRELIDRADGKAPRIAFFLKVDSVTLVFQQSTVLRNNIDQSVGHLYGNVGVDHWDEQTWKNQFDKNMIIVCTAAILHKCLLNGFVKIRQINLMIFDEAHHTKKDHPYARIIRDSYIRTELSERPRIFGMTASPIDARGNIVDAARELEILMDSKIATTTNFTALLRAVSRPQEEFWAYPKLNESTTTPLFRLLKETFGDLKVLEPVFRFAWRATSELGAWCADYVWTYALAQDVIPRLQAKIGRDSCSEDETTEGIERNMKRIHEAAQIVKNYKFKSPLEPGQINPKVELLLRKLSQHFGRSKDTKCIVFTRRRNTAKSLGHLCSVMKIPNLRPGILVGIRNHDITGTVTLRDQFLVLIKFRQGEINCLFATSVAEEGLDIPDCNLVVRFNLYKTLIQYIQSRGRARHADSTYAIMLEHENQEQQKRLQEVKEGEVLMRSFFERLPKDRLLHGNEDILEKTMRAQEGERTYTISTSGAKLTYPYAIEVLARFAHSLRYENELATDVAYFVTSSDRKFLCEIILPEKSPIRGVTGKPEARKLIAKQSAAFDLCLLLRKNHLLDDHFRSIYHKRLPAMRNARLAIISKKTNSYKMRCKPSIWTQEKQSNPELLYGTVIEFNPFMPLAREHGSLMLLTREKLPEFPSFPVFLENDRETQVRTIFLEPTLSVTSQELEQLTGFMVTIFSDLFHKSFEAVSETFPYWFAPAKATAKNGTSTTSPREIIDWDTLQFVHDNPEISWSKKMNPKSLCNKFIYDPWDGRKRYISTAIEYGLRASDPPPEWAPRRKWMENIMSYSMSLSKNSRVKVLADCDWSQPVLRAECISYRRNFLDPATETENSERAECCICVQPIRVSPIPLSIAISCLAIPAIITRLESYMIVQEGFKFIGLSMRLDYALEAFTKDSDNTEDHRALQVHIQRGMGKNYERLEFLGDSYLKMATSIALFCQNPDDDEYDYHVNRMCLICNKNMFNVATKIGLYEYIRSRGFSRHNWYPPGLQLLRGRDYIRHLVTESSHNLGEKTIADVCEALIGASLLSGGGENRFDMATKAVTVFVGSESHSATCWEGYRLSYTKPAYQIKDSDGFEKDLSQKIFEKLGYRFKYPRLLRSAFTHPSYPLAYAKVPCYQRLEFIGDALLDMVCVEHLFERFPDKDPQWLTEHKMAMVSNKFLGALAAKLGFHRHLQHFSNPIQTNITSYAEDIQTAEDESEGAMDYWLSTKDSPKCLPDMIEAYIAAIFVDSDFDYSVVEDFFATHIKPYFVDMSLYDTFANRHPTTYFFNQMTEIYGCTNYCVKAGELPGGDGDKPRILAAVMIHGESIAEDIGTSTRYAKVRASEKALEVIGGMLPTDFRLRFRCDCRPSSDDQGVKTGDIGTAI